MKLAGLLTVAGWFFLVVFAGLVWWPASIAVAGVACLMLARRVV